MKAVIMIVFLGWSAVSGAHPFWQAHHQGWHWYACCEFLKPHLKKPEHTPTKAHASMPALKKQLKATLEKAVLVPSKSNVLAYIRLQNHISALASRFSQQWQQVLLEHPRFNYSLHHPTTQLGKALYMDEQRKVQEKRLNSLHNRVGLLFFFRGDCPYCHRFAPILAHFAAHYHLTVLPVSLDGKGLPDFPAPHKDNGIATRLDIHSVPAVWAVARGAQKAAPIAYGLVTEDTLFKGIVHVLQQWRVTP